MAFLFFISYARADTKFATENELVKKFVDDLTASVHAKMFPPVTDVCFYDRTDIGVGTQWPDVLEDALCTSRVAVALYSPHYFASTWCGKEFQVFLDRAAQPGTDPKSKRRPIIPVLWTNTPLPLKARDIQHDDTKYPPEYREVDMRTLTKAIVYKGAYELAVEAIARSVVDAVTAADRPEYASLDLTTALSAWDDLPHTESHKSGSISKTCFVFVADQGWNWQPYSDSGQSIGALAQELSGQLGLRYEEIACDAGLIRKLEDTYRNNVPTLMFGDPNSLMSQTFAGIMRRYDAMYLLNCGTLIPWGSPDAADTYLTRLRNHVFPQKISEPPPNHEWRSIFSSADLRARTTETMEKLRQRLLNAILSSEASRVCKASDRHLTDEATQVGIKVDTAPQVSLKPTAS
jgi:hypothetical protein